MTKNQDGEWVEETIADTGMPRSIQVDREGRPHVVYQTNSGTIHAVKDLETQEWIIDSTFPLFTDTLPIADAALGLDSNGFLHVPYLLDLVLLCFLWEDMNGWHNKELHMNYFMPPWVSEIALTVDSKDLPHIAYFTQEGEYSFPVRYFHYDGSQWLSKLIDYNGEIERGAIAVDSLNRPHIVYNGWGPTYVYFDGKNWHYEILSLIPPLDTLRFDTLPSYPWRGSALAIDRNGISHVLLVTYCPGDADTFPAYVIYLRGTPAGIEEREPPSLPRMKLRILPNPSRGGFLIEYSLSNAQGVELSIYDLVGRRVKTIHRGTNESYGRVYWSGEDDKGRRVRGGVYFLRMKTEEGTFTKKLLLLR